MRIALTRREVSIYQAKRHTFTVAILSFLLAVLAPQGIQGSQDRQFVSPELVSAADIPYPPNSTATGIVTFLLTIGTEGQIDGVQVERDIPPLTGAARSAIQDWTFKAATLDGRPVPSQIEVNVVFNPFNPGGIGTSTFSLPPAQSSAPTTEPFLPARIDSGSFASYPARSISWGTVVLDLTVGKTGDVGNAVLTRGVASLTSEAMNAVETWRFKPATFQGRPIYSKTVVVFVFQRSMS
jgi:TonB family protein